MKSAELFQEVMENSLGILISFDDYGNVTYLNISAINEIGFNANEVKIYHIFSQLFTEDEDFKETVNKRKGETICTVAYRSNYTCFPALVRIGRIEFEDGTKINLISAINQYNENETKKLLEKTESDIRDIMKARNEFVANITHELRTPVNGIKGHVKNLLHNNMEPEYKKTLEIIERCCISMENIINNLLDFTKIESGKFILDEREFDIRLCVEHVIETSISVANEKGIKLSCFVAPDVPQKVIGDELRIMQILNNLVSNAIKFTSIGYVRVEVYKTLQLNKEIELSFLVIDTGIGISKDEKEKLFKSFSQVDASITRQYGGTGLGLFICRQLAELMRGTVKVESERGKGSTFQFTIVLSTSEDNVKTDTISIVKDELSSDLQTDLRTADGIEEVFNKEKKRKIIIPEVESIDEVYIYGNKKNRIETKNNFEKMIICIEMQEWEKAEIFADNLKRLLENGTEEIKSLLFKLQMNIRKEDHDKSIALFEQIKTLL